MIGLAFAWLATLSRYVAGRSEIQNTCILELLSNVVLHCLPLIHEVSQPHAEQVIENMTQFLKAYTAYKQIVRDNKDGISKVNITIEKINKHGLYTGFIVQHLLFSKVMHLYCLGLGIVKNLFYTSHRKTSEIVGLLEE